MRFAVTAVIVAALSGCATIPAAEQPVMAITVDDMPVHGEMPPGATPVSVARKVIAALRRENVPAYGFINAQWTEREPATMQVLTEWRAAGLPLANHGWAHRHLNEMSVAEFEQEVAKNEPVLQRLSSGN